MDSLARVPKQDRSRASFERVVDAAAEILEERGLEGLTLAEVSRRAGVSIGSIYGRVVGREELIRTALLRGLERADEEGMEHLAFERWSGIPLAALVASLLDAFYETLSVHAKLYRSCMQWATTDPVVGEAGLAAYARLEARFTSLLLLHRDEIRHRDPDLAVHTCFSISWATLARELGFGMFRPRPEETAWEAVRSELAAMFTQYLIQGREDA